VVEGPAFSPVFKFLTVAIVFGIAAWIVHLAFEGKVTGGRVSILTWFLAALAMLLYLAWWILRSRTRIDAHEISQGWAWEKKMAVGDLARVQLVRVRGLEWLIAPRLYARTLMGKFAVFYAADARLLSEFERMKQELDAFRRGKS
jgi:hypothetical protein